MFEMIKKGLPGGPGAALVTKQMVREATRSLVEQGKISTEEAEKLAEDLVRDGERQWNEMEPTISETLRNSLDKPDISSKAELQELKARVENLEVRTSMLETARSAAKGTGHGD